MSTWFYKNMGDALLAKEAVTHVESLFQTSYPSPPYPKDIAVFMRHDAEGQLHCILKLYFPPPLQALAQSLNASPCAKPFPQDLGRLIGSDQAKAYYFPT